MMGVRNPCGDDDCYMHLFAMYVKHLQFGNNYTNKTGLRSATVTGYGVAVIYLFTLGGFRSPYNTSDPNNIGAILISNYKTEEDIPSERKWPNVTFKDRLSRFPVWEAGNKSLHR
jgi:hypothetical protein